MTNLIVASDAHSSGAGSVTAAFAAGAGASYVGDTIIGFSDSSFPVVSPPWNTILNGAGASEMFVAWRLVTNDSRDAVPGYANTGAVVVSGAIGSYTHSETGTSGGSLSLTGTGLAVLWQYAQDNTGSESTGTPSGFVGPVASDDDNEDPGVTSAACEIDSKTYTSGVSTTNLAVGNLFAAAVLLGIVAAGGTNYNGSVSASVGETTTAAGVVGVRGTVSASVGETTTTTGVVGVRGTVSASVGETTTATGAVHVNYNGVVSASVGETTTTTGVLGYTGTASSSVGEATTAAGAVAVFASVSASVGESTTATGTVAVFGTVSVSVGETTTAYGGGTTSTTPGRMYLNATITGPTMTGGAS